MRDVLIKKFELQPHPEGGFYRETYRDEHKVFRETESIEQRSASTAIYYMLCDGAYSAWHRIRSDEVWHFYTGDPISIHIIDYSGRLYTRLLGNPLIHELAIFQTVVPAGRWFAAELKNPDSFALLGCTVAPGFEYSEFELAEIDGLLKAYPQHVDMIRRLGPRLEPK